MPPNGVENQYHLGALVPDIGNPFAAGTYFVSTLTLSINGAVAPGIYHIFLDNRAIVTDGFLNDHTLTANQVTIIIVPEPATTGLAVLGGVMLLASVWRARRVSA